MEKVFIAKITMGGTTIEYEVTSYTARGTELVLHKVDGGTEILPMQGINGIEVTDKKEA